MSEPDLPSHAGAAFSATTRRDGETAELALTGNADAQVTGAFHDLLTRLHPELVRLGVRFVVVDFRALEFMSSSCLRAFVTWISVLKDTDAGQQYRMVLRSNPELRWQRRSLNALAVIATSLVSVET